MRFAACLPIALVIAGCDPGGGQAPSGLKGTFESDGGPAGDTVQWRFAGDSVLYQKLNSMPEREYRYEFRDPYFISWQADADEGNPIGVAGRVEFTDGAFDFGFAHVFKSGKAGTLGATWRTLSGPDDSIGIVGDTILVKHNGDSRDTTFINVSGDRISEKGTGARLYGYKTFSDTLLLTYGKTWKFERVR